MSHYDYEVSKQIYLATIDEPFYALIMAAMRRADSYNLQLLSAAFPDVWDELQARYNAPGGLINSDCRCIEEWNGACPLHRVGGPRHADVIADREASGGVT